MRSEQMPPTPVGITIRIGATQPQREMKGLRFAQDRDVLDEAVEAGAGVMLGDGLIDVECECEGGAALLAGNSRLLTGAYGVEEGLDLETQGFALRDGGLREREAAEHGLCVGSSCG
jgi:hypothetical protein